MANQEHIDQLKNFRFPTDFNLWVAGQREKDSSFRLDLSEADLSKANLSEVNLRGANFSKTNLSGADFSRADLVLADFSRADLVLADLSGADLVLAHLSGADLRWANFSKTDLSSANLNGADLSGADLNAAKLIDADLSKANLSKTNLSGADLDGADLNAAKLIDADLRGANLRRCRRFRLDNNNIKETSFDPNSKDPWSILRRKYTGVMLFFNFLFLIIFLGTYTLQAVIWKNVNTLQEQYIENQESVTIDILENKMPTACLQQECDDPRPIWHILLGLHQGWNKFTIIVLLITYNVSRAAFTWWVGLLRDAEERSNHSPSLWQYIWWYQMHRVMSVLAIAAICSIMVQGYDLLTTTVVLPLQ